MAIRLAIAVIALATFSGCATNVYRLGPRGYGFIQGNAINLTIHHTPTSFYLHADRLDNSTATRAGGSVIGTTTSGAASIIASGAFGTFTR